MTNRDLPFGVEPFTVRDAMAAGMGRSRLTGKDLVRPFHGVRQRKDRALVPIGGAFASDAQRQQLRMLCLQYAVRMPPWQFFWGETALILLGAPVPRGWEVVVHVGAYRPASEPRTNGVVGHRLQARDPAIWASGNLRVDQPARAWVQASKAWTADDLIIAGDFLVSPRRSLATIDELRAEAIAMRRPRLLSLIDSIRAGSESSEETKLRQLLIRAGLPEPELNWVLYTSSGMFVARLDQAHVRYHVAVEYDGRQHELDGAQFAKDADRWDAIRAEGWDHVRILRHHMEDGGARAVAKVRTALLNAGWVPPARGEGRPRS